MANLDLSNRKLELDKIFNTVINKIPDLCMPQAYRLAQEDDFFGRAKSLELEPFRKQHYFDKYISLESQSTNQNNPFGSPISKADFANTTLKQPEIKLELEKLERSWMKQIRNKFELERMRKRELRELLKRRYTRLPIEVKAISNYCTNDHKLGYDKLFVSRPHPNYPYANPMPECMMTSENTDNLREIIVSTMGVEWKMLTPVRPDNDYEEKYFDKLIELHRNRHKARLDCGYYETNRIIPFKHVRHNYLINSELPTSTLMRAQMDPPTKNSSETNKEEESSGKERQKELLLDVEIPKLTLSSDEKIDELISDNKCVNLHLRRSSKANPRTYWEIQPKTRQVVDDERVDNRVEAIVSQLMTTSIDD